MRPTLLLLALLATAAPAQWTLQQSNTTASLRGIHAVTPEIAWASGTSGTVLHTTDGGAHWLPCATPPAAEHLDFRGIQAFDAQTAIVMSSGKGDLSRLYKTTDACQTWTLVFTNPDKEGFWDALVFPEPSTGGSGGEGILIGDPVNGAFAIFESSGQGSSWAPWNGGSFNPATNDKIKKASAGKGEGLFAASNQALSIWSQTYFIFVSGGASGASLYYSGQTGFCQELGGRCTLGFSHIALPSLGKSASSGAFAVASTDHHNYFPLNLMIVGGDYKHPDEPRGTSVFVSSRNGFHVPFTPYFDLHTPLTPPHGYRSAVAYDPAQKSWITVGPNGTDLSTDDGRNWHALRPSPGEAPDSDRNWNALSLPFAVGPQGRIGRLR